MSRVERRLPRHVGWAYIIAALLALLAGVIARAYGTSELRAIVAIFGTAIIGFLIAGLMHRQHQRPRNGV